LDFFLLGHRKEVIYRKSPEDLKDLNNKLHYAIWSIDNDSTEDSEKFIETSESSQWTVATSNIYCEERKTKDK